MKRRKMKKPKVKHTQNDRNVTRPLHDTETETNCNSVCRDTICARVALQNKDYQTALYFYQQAMSKDPPPENVDELLEESDTCYTLLSKAMRVPIRNTSSPLQSQVSYAKQEALIRSISSESDNSPTKPVDDALHHHCEQEFLIQAYMLYYRNDDTEDRLVRAFEYFQRASFGRATKSEANFRIAEMLYFGHGTTQNVEAALALFKETALLPHFNPADTFNNNKNIGVSESRYFLGKLVEESYDMKSEENWDSVLQIASMWYELGHQSHCPWSTSALGGLYLRGKGVPQNDRTAEKYWNCATKQKHITAYVYLAKLYIDQMEYRTAKSLINRGLESKDVMRRGLLEKLLKETDEDTTETESKVKAFEDEYNLSTEGLSFRERKLRMENKIKYTNEFIALINSFKKVDDISVTPRNSVNKRNPFYTLLEEDHIQELCWRNAIFETNYSQEFSKILVGYCRIMKVIEKCIQDPSKFTTDYTTASELIFLLWDYTKLEPFVINWNDQPLIILYSLLQEIKKANFGDKSVSFSKALEVCLGEIGVCRDPNGTGFEYLVRAWTYYPEEVVPSITLANHYAFRQDFDRAYLIGSEALERFPTNLNLLYNHAEVCMLTTSGIIRPPLEMKQLAVKCLTKFLNLAPVDHPKVPEAYYTLGNIYNEIYQMLGGIGLQLSIPITYHFLQLGKTAEENQLLCFKPYGSLMKESLEAFKFQHEQSVLFINHPRHFEIGEKLSPNNCSESPPIIAGVEQKKSNTSPCYFSEADLKMIEKLVADAERIKLIVELRNNFKNKIQTEGTRQVRLYFTNVQDNKPPLSLKGKVFQPITIREASSFQNITWENRVMAVVIIDEALSGFGLHDIHVVAEDINRDTIRVAFHFFTQDENVQKKFGFGCKLQILQPRIKLVEGRIFVEVNDPNTIIFCGKDESLCRCCLKPGAKTSCSRCRWANYCNKECQSYDWRVFKHKKICYPAPIWNKDLHPKT